MATRNRVAEAAAAADWGAVPAGTAGAGALALPEDDEAVEQSPIERVMVALQESVEPGKRVRLQLYRLVPDSPGKPMREEWCTDLTPEEFEVGGLGAIRDTWGPGGYVAHLMGFKRGSTYFTRVASPRFSIAPLPGTAGGFNAGARASESHGAFAGIEAAMRSMAESQARLLEALAESRATPAVNPVQQMQETLGLMSAMREAMGLNQQPAQRQEKSSIAEIVEAIKELKEVSSLVNPDSQPEKTDLEKVVEMAGPLVSMVQQAMTQRQIVPPVQLIPPHQLQQEQAAPTVTLPAQFAATEQTPQPTQHPEQQPAQQPAQQLNESDQAVLNELQGYLAKLVEMAEKSESTEKGAELVYDKLPDDWIEMLHMPIWWEALKTAAPQIEKHETWIRAVRDRVVQMFAEDAEEIEKVDGTAPGA